MRGVKVGEQQQFHPPSNPRASCSVSELKPTIVPSALDTSRYFSQETPSCLLSAAVPNPSPSGAGQYLLQVCGSSHAGLVWSISTSHGQCSHAQATSDPLTLTERCC